MTTWNDTTELSENGLLPTGKQTMRLVAARVGLSEHNGTEQAYVELEASDGTVGEITIPLEPWDRNDATKIEQFERLFKTHAAGLGFTPAYPDRSIEDIAGDEFPAHLHNVVGRTLNTVVTHVPSKTLKDDGTPFINHRVRFKGLVGGETRAMAGAI